MTIWSSNSTSDAFPPVPARPVSGRWPRRVMALVVTTCLMTLALVVLPATAQAATPTVALTAAVTPGNPAVAFTATVGSNAVGDTAYLCFGDEAPVLCDAATAGTAVDMTTATAVGGAAVSHTYAKEGTFSAVLYEVSGTTVTASSPSAVVVTIDGTAQLTATATGLTAVLDGSASTAAVATDTWWACFGEHLACSATAPDLSGTVGVNGPPLNKVSHIYAKPSAAAGYPAGYPASLTVVGTAVSSTVSLPVLVNFPDPTAILTADSVTGTGILPVIFYGNQSSVSTGDSWGFCFGDVPGCSATTPDQSGSISGATPTVALTGTHTYLPGNYTAALWVSKPGSTTSTATLAITVGNPVAAPDGTCALSGIIRTCDLYAKANGTVTAGPDTIKFWGFTTSDTATPVLGGPTLIATEGEKLAFTVHNQLDPRAGNVAITVPSLAGAPDLIGVATGAAGGSGSFTLTRPGTYVYEAGLTSGGARQVAMGLSGMLIVRPSVVLTSANSAHCAYDGAVNVDCLANKDTRNYYDREKVVKVDELDAAFTADPFGSDTGDYHPTNYFVDGVAYDSAKAALDPAAPAFNAAVNSVRLDASPGDSVLLRYADLGLREHSMNLLNLVQTETARDANVLPNVTVQSTEFLNAGQTADTFLVIPPGAVTGTRYPLYDAGMHLNNGATGGLGGLYTYLNVVNGTSAADIGPVGTAASVVPTFTGSVPNIDNGQVPTLTVAATFKAQTAGASVSSVQWSLDVPSPDSLWQPSGAAIPAGSATATVPFTIDRSTLTQQLGIEPDRIFGEHTIWLQAMDSNGKVGPVVGASFSLAMRDAVISTLAINPQVTNGTTRSNQFPVASTKISAPSNEVNVPASVIYVNSTAGFPGTCDTGGCLITVATTIADGPAQGDLVYQTFTYTGLGANTQPNGPSFNGVRIVTPVPRNTYLFDAGNTVALDVVPAGYIALNATATSSLPGWVVEGAQACVVYAPGAVPGPADQVESKCNPGNKKVVTELNVNAVDSLVAVNGFLPPPRLPDGINNAANFWVMVRALEGPDGTDCIATAVACRYSPWLYYHPVTTTTTTTRDLAQDNIPVVSTLGFPSRGQLTATTTAHQIATVNYYGINPTRLLTNNGGAVPGTLATGTLVTGSAAGPDTYQTLTLVKAGPQTTLLSATPNPNNGFDAAAGNLGLFDSFDVQATATSKWAAIALAEAFVAPTSRARGAAAPALRRCSVKPNIPAGCVIFGQGAEMAPADGLWGNSSSKVVTAFLPLSLLQGMPDGLVRVWVHAKDIAGNWGPFEAVDLMLDRTAPILDSATNTAPAGAATTTTAAATLPMVGTSPTLALTSVTGFPRSGGFVAVTTSTGVQVLTYTGITAKTLTGVTGGTAATIAAGAPVAAFTGTASVRTHDVNSTATGLVSSGVASAEWFVGPDPGPGNGTKAVTIPVALPPSKNSPTVLTFSITGLPVGKTVSIRVVDAAGNWSAVTTVVM
ncbi:hypothetical protein [Nakamurella sp. PAMC28650]|uniref:hypothetical protein n=1 Tax=Nakamurella sp. PAMC28650 TaxID=2762325 RepID=UPI00164DBD6E|nr:hypothetical protein [Nakamurella sp. PAMC28650]QNK79433.1 hypothetical protein H7F38_14075 [Nakamurella sp. PAMC28650]